MACDPTATVVVLINRNRNNYDCNDDNISIYIYIVTDDNTMICGDEKRTTTTKIVK